jgi:hypothetical protein
MSSFLQQLTKPVLLKIIYIKSLKGLSDTVQVMTTNYKLRQA